MPAAPEAPPATTARCIELDGRPLAYRLRRARRRTIGLTIDRRGLTVSAPPRARIGEIEAAIRHHAEWVLAKLAAWQDTAPPAFVPHDGAELPFLGAPLRLALHRHDGRLRRIVWDSEAAPPRLTLGLPAATDARTALRHALRERARHHFAGRLAHFAPLVGVSLPPLALSSARTRWGSCSASGGVRLNWRLIHFPGAVIDYVVVHELAHLHEMNHGPRFWSHVERVLPDWKARRLALRQHAAACPILEDIS